MKYITIIFFSLLLSQLSMSQSIVGNVKRGPFLIAELSVKINDTSSLYKLKYLDAKSEVLKYAINSTDKYFQLQQNPQVH
mgnify:CR=1 FL=1